MIANVRGIAWLVLVVLAVAGCRGDGDSSEDPNNGTSALNAVPEITGTPAASGEVGRPYAFEPDAFDSDGDVLTFKIANRPDWANFNTETGRLSGTPPVDAATLYRNISVSVSDGNATASLPTFDLEIEGTVGNPPSISGTPPRRVVVGHSYDFTAQATDVDGDMLAFSISGQPEWLQFDVDSGRLHGTPDTSDVGSYANIAISVTDGHTSVALPSFAIEVATGATNPPTNTAPTIAGVPAQTVVAGQTYRFLPTAADADEQALTFAIAGKPSWASFNANTGLLSGTPSVAMAGVHENISITVTDGTAVATLPTFSITVLPANNAPRISGSPATSVNAGNAYVFQPTASDPDGQTLTFRITGKPAWASFAASSGRLTGTPAQAQAGTYPNISITVSDGVAQATLGPFAIEVAAANRAPVLNGAPMTSVASDAAYDFRPTASDPDGDTLTYTISGKPAWASFNATSGRLYGSPTAADEGNHANIVITVSDGELTDTIGPFAINVTGTVTGSATLDWSAPTSNDDGSPLTDLAGYRVYYGRQQSSLGSHIEIPSAGITSATIEDLAAATWYFAVTAYTSGGTESSRSSIVSKTIN